MLLGTTMGRVALLDAFTGDLLRTFSGHSNQNGQPLECAFAPDAQSVYSGSEDGAIWRWQTQTGAALAPLRAHRRRRRPQVQPDADDPRERVRAARRRAVVALLA